MITKLQKVNNSDRVRLQTYPVSEIFDFIDAKLAVGLTASDLGKFQRVSLKWYYTDAKGLRMSVRRAIVFHQKGVDCKCGMHGQFFALERSSDNSLHLDLYAIDDVNDEVLMTIDHINPKSKGGLDNLDNYATLCWPCNFTKADNTQK